MNNILNNESLRGSTISEKLVKICMVGTSHGI